MTRTAAVFAWLAGIEFGLPAIQAIHHFVETGAVWTFMGFPTYGEGPIEEMGIATSVPLLVAFFVVYIAELVMGWLLWTGRRRGVALSFGLLPLELVFWIGFGLPVGPAVALVRTGLVIAVLRANRSAGPDA